MTDSGGGGCGRAGPVRRWADSNALPSGLCLRPATACAMGVPTGTCQPVLAQCPEAAEDDAVCGCGGATYASRCHAQLHNEDVMEPGICRDQGYNRCSAQRRAAGGTTTFTAPHPLGHCDAVPFCMPNPNMCSQEESPERGSPVCDCEGNEHHNLCNARFEGKSVRNTGPCR